MKSMTGFAETTQTGDGFHVDLRMRAVNGKHLDAQFRMPDTLLSLEPRLLAILKQQVNRGRVTCWVDLRIDDPDRAGVKLNTHLLGNLARQFDQLQQTFPDLRFSVPLTAVFNREANLIQSEPDSVFMDQVCVAVETGFRELVVMFDEERLREGTFLRDDFARQLDMIRVAVDELEQLREGFFEKQLAASRERLNHLLADHAPDETRLIQEAGLLADKLDITEEITRLRSHLEAFRGELTTDGPVGKKLDFMLQEMNREVNTIGSKGRDELVSRQVVAVKTELEKIREQVQNIE